MKRKITGDELAVGGQAVIEGVLMRSQDKYSISVRDEKGKIHNKTETIPKKSGLMRVLLNSPLIRGTFVLIDSVKIGYKALTYSVEVAFGEEETTWVENAFLIISNIIAVIIALTLFKFVPYWIPTALHADKYFTLWEGLIKLAVFIGYLLIISLSKDIRRVFEYHGAEHMVVHAYEKYGNKLTVKKAKEFSTIHKRCGTTFIFLVVFVSILVYTLLPKLAFWNSFILRLAFLPVIAGIAYEILRAVPRLSPKNPIRWILTVFEYPGLWIEYITTKKPDEKQLEVAIHALKKVI